MMSVLGLNMGHDSEPTDHNVHGHDSNMGHDSEPTDHNLHEAW